MDRREGTCLLTWMQSLSKRRVLQQVCLSDPRCICEKSNTLTKGEAVKPNGERKKKEPPHIQMWLIQGCI